MFKPLQVIRSIRPMMNSVGIIDCVDGHRYRIMFEMPKGGVEFVWYSVT